MSLTPPDQPNPKKDEAWYSSKIPDSIPISDQLWAALARYIPKKYQNNLPLVRRDLEGCSSSSINADTALLLLLESAQQVKFITLCNKLNEEISRKAEADKLLETKFARIEERLKLVSNAIGDSCTREQMELYIQRLEKSAEMINNQQSEHLLTKVRELLDREDDGYWWWEPMLTIPKIYWILGCLLIFSIISNRI